MSTNHDSEYRMVQLQLIQFIRSAATWADIYKAADAMFHVRLLHERVFATEHDQANAPQGNSATG